MDTLQVILLFAALLCALVAGFLYSFAVVVMPGIGRLPARDYLAAFKETDGVIQRNSPTFLIIWVGSVLTIAALAIVGFWQLEGINLLLLMGAAALYFLCVQLPTFVVNIPLNNRIQATDLSNITDTQTTELQQLFQTRWEKWHIFRTLFAIATTILLMGLMVRL